MTLNVDLMKSPNSTTVIEVKEIIHDTVVKALDSVITLNDLLMTSPHFTTVVEIKGNIHDTIIMI